MRAKKKRTKTSKVDLLTKTRRELIAFMDARPRVPIEMFEELFTEGLAFARSERIGMMIEGFMACEKHSKK